MWNSDIHVVGLLLCRVISLTVTIFLFVRTIVRVWTYIKYKSDPTFTNQRHKPPDLNYDPSPFTSIHHYFIKPVMEIHHNKKLFNYVY